MHNKEVDAGREMYCWRGRGSNRVAVESTVQRTEKNRSQMFHCCQRELRSVALSLIEDFPFSILPTMPALPSTSLGASHLHSAFECTWHSLATPAALAFIQQLCSSILIGRRAETFGSGEALLSTHIICTIQRGKTDNKERGK